MEEMQNREKGKVPNCSSSSFSITKLSYTRFRDLLHKEIEREREKLDQRV
jgi:hypothetical protein